ncbi:MAG: ABC transporter ATP-binding protein/permease [Clostridium sp.]|nr:ABC transporter ATP-binding protein/permease [Clostridium sp.]
MIRLITKTARIFSFIKPAFRKCSLILPVDCFVRATLVLADVFLPIMIINTVSQVHVTKAIFIVAFILLCRFGLGALERWTNIRSQNECRCINDRVEFLLSEKLISIDYLFLENQTFLDEKSGATFSIKNYKAIDTLIQCLSTLLCQIIVLLLSGSYLLLSHPLLLFLVFISFLLQLFVNQKLNEKLDPFFNNLFPINRRFRWLSSLKFDVSRQKDIRMHHMIDLIDEKARYYNQMTCNTFSEMNQITWKSSIAIHVINTLCMYAGYLYNAVRILSNKMSIGTFLSISMLLGELNSTLSSISDNYTSYEQMLSYLDPVVSILSKSSSDNGHDPLSEIDTIEFHQVSFQYPTSTHLVLDQISFKIERGERIALVGLNGAGKTTIVKLLCRLYSPSEGEILINGINIACFDKEQYLSKLSIVFQDFMIFDFSVSENITLDLAFHSDRYLDAIRTAGFTLGNGIDSSTLLGPQTNRDGIRLSGGQSQRLAMARAIYRNGDIFILDEPDSSIDPLVEYNIYRKYNIITCNQTSLFVSHRMITTQFCDKILVLDSGKVAAFLPPSTLLTDTDSLYYKLYHLQKNQILQ